MFKKKDKELNSIIEGFQIFSSETNGLINPNEFKEIMETMNMSEKNPFLYNIIKNFCLDPQINQKGGIEAEDFILKLEEKLNNNSSLEELNNLFLIFSNPITDKIPITAFSDIAKNIGEEENEEKIKNLVKKSQMGNKELDFKEFKDLVYNENIILEEENEKSSNIENYNDKDNKYNYNYNNEENNKYNNEKNNIKNNYINNNIYDSLNSNSVSKNTEMYNSTNKKKYLIYNDSKNNINNEIKEEKIISNENKDNNNIYINYNDTNETNKSDNINYTNDDIYDIENIDKNYTKNIYKPNKKIQNITIEEEKDNIINNKKYTYQQNYVHIPSKKEKNRPKFRYSKSKGEIKDNNFENEKNDDEEENEENTYKNNFTRGRIVMDDSVKSESIINKEENENINNKDEKNDIKTNKRYHRRYREMKSNNDKKEEKVFKNNYDYNNNNNFGFVKYRKK